MQRETEEEGISLLADQLARREDDRRAGINQGHGKPK